MVNPVRIVLGAMLAAAALVTGAAPGASVTEDPPTEARPPAGDRSQVLHCTPFVGMASGSNQSCTSSIGGGLVATYHLHQGESADGRPSTMTCTIFGGMGTGTNQSCTYTVGAGLIAAGMVHQE